jgi:hypothetical protein
MPAEPGEASVYPATPMGRCAAAFVAMVNDASAGAVESFEGAWASKRRASQRPLADRVSGIARLHEQWGDLRVYRVTDRGGAIVVEARGEKGVELEMEFEQDSSESGKLGTVTIRAGEGARSGVIDAKQRDLVTRQAANVLVSSYVYPEIGDRMADAVISALEGGAYDAITDEAAFAERLTRDMRAVSNDKHLRVRLAPAERAQAAAIMPSGDEARRDNYAFRRVEILPGNIGYVKFDLFHEEPGAMKAAEAAMGFVRNADAVIFDLRSNGGGSPEMIRFITSYLFETRTHLNSMVDRNGNVVEEYWTLEKVPGERLAPGTPVFVLTSGSTFSGAEEFSYNLQNLKRGVIVGETTGGGAHPVRAERLNDRFVIGVPFMRAMNPITKTNWEGTGVTPDVRVDQEAALDRALTLARDAAAQRRAGGR